MRCVHKRTVVSRGRAGAMRALLYYKIGASLQRLSGDNILNLLCQQQHTVLLADWTKEVPLATTYDDFVRTVLHFYTFCPSHDTMRPELKRAVERALCASPRILNGRYILTFPGDWRCSFAETWAGVAAFSSHTDPSAVRANARTLPWTGDNLHKRTCEGESWYTNVRWYESPNMCVSKCGSKLTVVCEQLNRKKKKYLPT